MLREVVIRSDGAVDDDGSLRDAAERRGVSMAQVVRDAVDEHLDADPDDRERRWERALAAVGAHRSDVAPGTPVGRDHDDSLPDAYESPGK